MNTVQMEGTSYDGQSTADELTRSLSPVCQPQPQNMQEDAEQIDDGINEICTVVAALNFGNTYSGYAFSTKSDFEKNPLNISINTPGKCTGRSLFGKRYPTCILFDSKQNFLSFGYDAEKTLVDYGVGERESCFFFRHLLETLMFDGIIDENEDGFDNERFKIQGFLKALIVDCKKRMENSGEVTRWVITIPADMTDAAEKFLKNCIQGAGIPPNQLTLVTEVEASFAYCQKLLESERNSKFEDSTEYMIVDFGEYYDDIRVVKKVCGELREKYRQTRTEPRQSVYEQFIDTLNPLLSDAGIEALANDPFALFELERGLEEVKLSKSETSMRVQLHQSTLAVLRKLCKRGKIDVEKVTIAGKYMTLRQGTFEQIFKESIEHVISQMEKVFEVYREANNISHIVMTGDFYQSCLVKENVEKKINFPKKRIICSAIEEETVVKGAVLYGWQPYKHTFELLRAYDKPADQKGFVMVINFLFEDTDHKRTGSMEDVKQLKDFFAKYSYEVRCYSDMTLNELKSTLLLVRDDVMVQHSDTYHSFICVIMSHGNQSGISTTSGIISVEQIVSPFKNDQAKSFIGKPKIFLVQACRGRGKQNINKYEIPHDNIKTDYMERIKTPTDADIITIYATTPGYVSIRTTRSPNWIGAWFIHAFITAAEMYPKNHLLEILTAVNYELANNPEYVFEDGKKGQMSMAEVTLTKLFYL